MEHNSGDEEDKRPKVGISTWSWEVSYPLIFFTHAYEPISIPLGARTRSAHSQDGNDKEGTAVQSQNCSAS